MELPKFQWTQLLERNPDGTVRRRMGNSWLLHYISNRGMVVVLCAVFGLAMCAYLAGSGIHSSSETVDSKDWTFYATSCVGILTTCFSMAACYMCLQLAVDATYHEPSDQVSYPVVVQWTLYASMLHSFFWLLGIAVGLYTVLVRSSEHMYVMVVSLLAFLLSFTLWTRSKTEEYILFFASLAAICFVVFGIVLVEHDVDDSKTTINAKLCMGFGAAMQAPALMQRLMLLVLCWMGFQKPHEVGVGPRKLSHWLWATGAAAVVPLAWDFAFINTGVYDPEVYGLAGYWCWITKDHTWNRVFGLWIWDLIILVLLLYVPTNNPFSRRRTHVFSWDDWRMPWPHFFHRLFFVWFSCKILGVILRLQDAGLGDPDTFAAWPAVFQAIMDLSADFFLAILLMSTLATRHLEHPRPSTQAVLPARARATATTGAFILASPESTTAALERAFESDSLWRRSIVAVLQPLLCVTAHITNEHALNPGDINIPGYDVGNLSFDVGTAQPADYVQYVSLPRFKTRKPMQPALVAEAPEDASLPVSIADRRPQDGDCAEGHAALGHAQFGAADNWRSRMAHHGLTPLDLGSFAWVLYPRRRVGPAAINGNVSPSLAEVLTDLYAHLQATMIQRLQSLAHGLVAHPAVPAVNTAAFNVFAQKAYTCRVCRRVLLRAGLKGVFRLDSILQHMAHVFFAELFVMPMHPNGKLRVYEPPDPDTDVDARLERAVELDVGGETVKCDEHLFAHFNDAFNINVATPRDTQMRAKRLVELEPVLNDMVVARVVLEVWRR